MRGATEMTKDIPIIFSAPMVRALLEGRKTMTRRTLKPQPTPFLIDGKPCDVTLIQLDGDPRPRVTLGRVITTQEVRFAPGDRLWIRENFKPVHSGDPGQGVRYRADVGRDDTVWRPSIHMPRWASRLMLIVTAVKIERLRDISEKDAEAEGCVEDWADGLSVWYVPGGHMERHYRTGRECFEWLWTRINGPEAWDTNPFVVAITFRVIKANIDSPEARAAA